MLRVLTAGESHGKTMMTLIDGFPAGLEIDTDQIDTELRRRQGGYGRGGRMRIEKDKIELLTGIWKNTTLGSPIAMQVVNKDYKLERLEDLPRPRPGHGDLTGAIKYLGPIRGILERASARETTARVAGGALASQLLKLFGIECLGYVVEIGDVVIPPREGTIEECRQFRDDSALYTLDPGKDDELKKKIDACGKDGDTLGGIVEVRVDGLPFGLGSHAQWDRKLDGKLAQAVMSIQAFKGVEIGLGFQAARLRGSQVHDPIYYNQDQKDSTSLGYERSTNNAGGLEAGMTNGQRLIVRGAKKPISTLAKPLDSIDLNTKEPQAASYERSDVCAISAASVIAEAVVATEIATALCEKFGNDSVVEMKARYDAFHELAKER